MCVFKYNDGGRKEAGYKGEASDCVTRSIAIVTGKSYQQVYDELNKLSEFEKLSKKKKKRSSSNKGVYKVTYKKYLLELGMKWVPLMAIGKGCTTHLKAEELPKGRLLVSVSKHLTAVLNGVINDTHDCSREGTRCVYGYFTFDKNKERDLVLKSVLHETEA